MGVFQKPCYPKMDGENNGSKPYEQMDDLGVPLFFGNIFFLKHPYIQMIP